MTIMKNQAQDYGQTLFRSKKHLFSVSTARKTNSEY